MFLFTARIPRRRLMAGGITVGLCALAVITALAVTFSSRSVTTGSQSVRVRTNEDRLSYLNTLGWQVSETVLRTEELRIPDTLDASYEEYLTLQTQQGFDLRSYCGRTITRYIYQVENHPQSAQGVEAALLVYRSRVIGGHIQAADGSFVQPLTSSAAAASAQPTPSPTS